MTGNEGNDNGLHGAITSFGRIQWLWLSRISGEFYERLKGVKFVFCLNPQLLFLFLLYCNYLILTCFIHGLACNFPFSVVFFVGKRSDKR